MALKMNQVPAFDPVLLTVPQRAMLSPSPDQRMNPVLRLDGPTSYNTVYSSMTSRGSDPHSYFIFRRCFSPHFCCLVLMHHWSLHNPHLNISYFLL